MTDISSAAGANGTGDDAPTADAPTEVEIASLWAMLESAVLDAEQRFEYAPPPPRPPIHVWTWIRSALNVQTVIDIGANTGEYTEYLARLFNPSVIYAFEPLASCQPRLRALAEHLPQLQIFTLALDDHAGHETFWENDYGPSSSLLQVSDLHKQAFPHTERAAATTVEVARLDDVLDAATLERDIFVKIDVQGVEDRVIRGGRAIFSAAAMVLVEMSFLQMYDEQPLFEEIHDLLVSCGLRLVGVKNQIEDEKTGQPLFAHCYYGRLPTRARSGAAAPAAKTPAPEPEGR